ncbi:hypothetical protein NKR23_g9632 [Pleurostoma richardsiae]|uniref:MAPEG family protein n=1 Tax=Pleurostoma richardsiae TaxID=41990 RepID=A0AA38RF07_9PEZI|nr:hypothetical protein NKR23_g9632 [Pleurostoma richardsiae]
MASIFDLSKPTLSFYSVPVAFLLIMVPHSYATSLAGKAYDLANPRMIEEFAAKDEKIDKVTLRRIRRANAAQDNGFESLGMYAGGIVAANAAGVLPATVNSLALAYLAVRVVYNFVYVILQDNRKFAPLRSLMWITSVGIMFALWIKAGNAAAL